MIKKGIRAYLSLRACMETKRGAASSPTAPLPRWSWFKAHSCKFTYRVFRVLFLEGDKCNAMFFGISPQGKPIVESKAEITYGASFLEWFAGEARRMYGDHIPSSMKGKEMLLIRQPIGVAAIITPVGSLRTIWKTVVGVQVFWHSKVLRPSWTLTWLIRSLKTDGRLVLAHSVRYFLWPSALIWDVSLAGYCVACHLVRVWNSRRAIGLKLLISLKVASVQKHHSE